MYGVDVRHITGIHVSHIMSSKAIVMLTNVLALPHIRFCMDVWGSCNVTQGRRVNKIIKFARPYAGRKTKGLVWHDVVPEYNNYRAENCSSMSTFSRKYVTPTITSF